jgi:hypothetical protein
MMILGQTPVHPFSVGSDPCFTSSLGSDPELRKWVFRCLTHFCHRLLSVDDLTNATAQISDNRYAALVFHTDGPNDAKKPGGMVH